MTKVLITKNGSKVTLEPKYLSEEFCEKVQEHSRKKHKLRYSFPFNSFFMAQAVEEYIIDTNSEPEYE